MTPSSHGENAPSASLAGRSAVLWAIGGLGVAGVFLWCLFVIPGLRDALPVGDRAVIELYTLLASRGWWEYGPYSRFGWHHPGPLVFYLMTPFYTASHEQSLAVNAGAVAINLIALTTILWVVARHASAALCVSVTAAIALYLWRMPLLLVSAWNPHIVLLPLATLIAVAFAAVVRVRDDVGDYMVSWVTVIGIMSIGALAAALVARVPAASIPAKRIKWLAPVLTSVCLIAASTHGLIGLERMRAELTAPRSDGFRTPVDSVHTALRAFLARTHVRRPLIRVAGTWDSATALVLQLHKRRQPVAVSDDALWLVGMTFEKNGREDADLTLADRTERQNVRTRDGDCMLIERHGLSLHVLLPSLQAPIALTCE